MARLQQIITTHSAVTLTNAYAGNVSQVVALGSPAIVELYASYTDGASESGNQMDIRIEFSPDNSNWYLMSKKNTTTSQLTEDAMYIAGSGAATAVTASIPIEVADGYMRISLKETGVSSNYGAGTVKIAINENY